MRPPALLLAAALMMSAVPAWAQRAPEAAPALPEPVIAMVPAALDVVGFLGCMREQGATILSAHRGGPMPGYPENALETFAFTLSRLPALIELDVVRSRDGVHVLMHDSELGRTSTGSGPVAGRTLAQLRDEQLRDPTGFAPRPAMRIPTLEEALTWAKGRAILKIDPKRGADLGEIVAAVQRHGLQGQTAIIVSRPEEAARVAALDPVISLSVSINRPEALEELIRAGVPESRMIAWTGINTDRPELWAELRRRGIPVIFGTLWSGDREIAAANDNARYARLAEAGVDVLVTDRHFDAHWALETRQDTAAAVRACVRE